ncbi:inner membrane protein YhaI [Catellatospora sp. IY07-71]|uniref:DUF805 domain-containing protein n=1 Tax=Catellatospora sp. IY07-71 TaxID=2728827 RepID=UPI001BB43330|nr:DUF805 domain-containing protein [Catellatospora sp. IY07-71]BCJ72253.1 inner membrane protein YhaI [Catellatospora sp. IY07-71]
MSWYLNVLKNYATFRGRARRKEYWMFVLIHLAIVFALFALFGSTESEVFYYLYVAYFLGTLLPMLAVIVRRLHDTGRPGAWFLITFLPVIGGFWLLTLLVDRGQPQANVYGPDPKAAQV